MKYWFTCWLLLFVGTCGSSMAADAVKPKDDPAMKPVGEVAINKKADGYRGIWYMNQPVDNVYAYKYSGGLGTYCDYHAPFAIYRPEVNKTFFCYGGAPADNSRKLLHMVSYFDHATGTVPRPTLLLDKRTDDAHDNPVMAIDKEGYIWIFSTAHGLGRPSYIHRSVKPYDIDKFERVHATHLEDGKESPLDNFSYFQIFYDANAGFRAIFTRYHFPAARTACFMTSRDGVHWSEWQRLAAIERGHYQIGAVTKGKLATMFNMHPKPVGLNARTNLYYIETLDNGKSWQTASGQPLKLPLTEVHNPALIHDYQAEGLLVYAKDMKFDSKGYPVLLYSTSRGFEPGPENGDRMQMVARWNGSKWDIHEIAKTDHNYDSASISFDDDGTWRVIAATEPGPQPYGTGGELVVWTSSDEGATWRKEKQLTNGSKLNQTYARRPVNAHPDFFALWADGNARKPSESHIYFCNAGGHVFQLPPKMESHIEHPRLIIPGVADTSAK